MIALPPATDLPPTATWDFRGHASWPGRRLLPLLAFFLCYDVSAEASAQDRLAEIIDNVRANEELYRNIEVSLRKKYRLGTPKATRGGHLTSADANSRFVYQNGLIYFRNDEQWKRVDGVSERVDTLQGYDGQYTRIIEQKIIANLHQGRFEDARLLRPHAWLLAIGSHVCFPLSRYLQGSDALKDDPAAGVYARRHLEVEFVGEEVLDGLQCLKLRSVTWAEHESPEMATIRFLWLAPDRNFFPVKMEGYEQSLKTPVGVGRAEDFREISPGVWFPFLVSHVVYDRLWLSEDNKVVVNNSEEYIVEKAALDPNYDISLFRDIRFPNEIMVYVVKHGQIVKSYWHEGTLPGDLPQPGLGRWWLAIGGLAVLVAGGVAGFVYYRGRWPSWPWLPHLRGH